MYQCQWTVQIKWQKVFDSCLRFPVLEIHVIIVFWYIPIEKESTREIDVVFQ